MNISHTDVELDKGRNEVIANKSKLVTTTEIYNKIYSTQLLEILKLSISFLISQILLILLKRTIFQYYEQYLGLYIILLISLLVYITLTTVSISTYLKIINDKNEFLNKILSQQKS